MGILFGAFCITNACYFRFNICFFNNKIQCNLLNSIRVVHADFVLLSGYSNKREHNLPV